MIVYFGSTEEVRSREYYGAVDRIGVPPLMFRYFGKYGVKNYAQHRNFFNRHVQLIRARR